MKIVVKNVLLVLIVSLLIVSCWWKKESSFDSSIKEITNSSTWEIVTSSWDLVSVHYTGTFENGEKFDSSLDRGVPLDFQVGWWQMISWFDSAVIGMKVWDKKSIKLSPQEAYWERSDSNFKVVPKVDLKSFSDAWIKLEKWSILPTQVGNIEIINSDETTVTLDWNHPMAGKTLNFDIEMVKITRN